jgi:hypothetical protein
VSVDAQPVTIIQAVAAGAPSTAKSTACRDSCGQSAADVRRVRLRSRQARAGKATLREYAHTGKNRRRAGVISHMSVQPAQRDGVTALALGATFAGYRVEEAIGEGTVGVVYRATQLALGRPSP